VEGTITLPWKVRVGVDGWDWLEREIEIEIEKERTRCKHYWHGLGKNAVWVAEKVRLKWAGEWFEVWRRCSRLLRFMCGKKKNYAHRQGNPLPTLIKEKEPLWYGYLKTPPPKLITLVSM